MDRRHQKKRDTEQDTEIKKLKTQIDQADWRKQAPRSRSSSRSRSRARIGDRDGNADRDEVSQHLSRSGAQISREFDEGYAHLGRRFAVGDAVTENKLQAQVIALQQTVINVLQEALYDGRQLDRVDMAKLMAASNAARDGSLDALRQQRQRQMLAIEAPPGSRGAHGFEAPKRASTILDSDPLYCSYSLDLQYIRNKPLAANFARGGSCRCPACGVRLGVESNDFWEIDKRTPRRISEGRFEREVVEEREFHLGQRFIVKCHTPDGEFACVLCTRHRDRDAICPTVKSLVNHVGKFHEVSELEKEVDFDMRLRRTDGGRRPLPLALPAPKSDPEIDETGSGGGSGYY